MRKNFKSHPIFKFAADPYWLLLSKANDREQGADFGKTCQNEFLSAVEHIKNKRLKLTVKIGLSKVFKLAWLSMLNYSIVLKHYSWNDLYKDGRCIRPKPLQNALQASIDAVRLLRKKLENEFVPNELVKIQKVLGCPSNVTPSIYLNKLTGSQRLDRMSGVVFVNSDKPRILFSAIGTRDELDGCTAEIANKKLFPALPLRQSVKPYVYKHIDGFKYVAVDIYKGKLSQIRKLWPLIESLQADLLGNSWKDKRKRSNLKRDLDIKAIKQGNPRKTYDEIAYQVDPQGLVSIEAIRQAHHRVKSK